MTMAPSGAREDFYSGLQITDQIPNTPINSFYNRNVKILGIMAGISGIMMAYKIQKSCKNVELKIYEKNADIVGTWLENRYPKLHSNGDSIQTWPSFFSKAGDIWAYLNKVCDVFGIRNGKWRVQLQQNGSTGESREFDDECDIVLHSTGVLNKYAWPKLFHTGAWPEGYTKEQWKDENVAVIDSGAPSIQTVPGIQPYVKHMDLFVRTAVWFVQTAKDYGQNYQCTEDQKFEFHEDPSSSSFMLKTSRTRSMESSRASSKIPMRKAKCEERMVGLIKCEKLRKGFTLKFGGGCRRVTPRNVDVHFTGVDRLTEDGVVGSDGVERKVDTVHCATAFDATFRPVFHLIGKSEVDLSAKWAKVPECYMGLTIPGFPNLITFNGPT
ncbi:hypothetical protein N7467_010578 [Penicillium canescens]|nr:hypothetical protein N7467_010578 [Penicillium canescens]